jgi:outer membrane protein assembly factor BamA
MRMGKKYYGIIVWICCLPFVAAAQVSPPDSFTVIKSDTVRSQPVSRPFVVGEIFVEGAKKTKPYIIERELPFKTGDSVYLPDLVKGFEIARQQLMNTTLFNEAIVALKAFRGFYVDIIIQVKERWYIFPLPYLKPVDRNLSEWAKQGYGLDRVNYGFKFTWYNFTGRNDKLRLWLITGYSKQIEFQYDQPYADKSLKHGYKIGFAYSFNKEVNYTTMANQQQFTDTFPNGIKRWNGSLEYTYRPGLRTFHGVRLSITREEVDSGIVLLNPKYYNAGKTSVTYPELSYSLSYVNVDYKPFPLKGWQGDFNFVKRGIHANMNMWQLGGKVTISEQIAKKTFFSWQGYGTIRFPFDQPYINQRMFGYGDLYLRGLENYVIDGVAAFMSRQTLRRELVRFSVKTHLKSKSHDRIPFRIYARTFGDLGYSYNKNFTANSLTNRMLYTGGFGVDVVTFYDFILRFDYSFNQLGENGLFLHVKNEF